MSEEKTQPKLKGAEVPTRWSPNWPHGDRPYARSAEELAAGVSQDQRAWFEKVKATGNPAVVMMVGTALDPEWDFVFLAHGAIAGSLHRPFLMEPHPGGMRVPQLDPIHRQALLRCARFCASFSVPFIVHVSEDVLSEFRPDRTLWQLIIHCRIPSERVWRARAPSTIDGLLGIYHAWAESLSTGKQMPAGLGLPN